MMFFCLNFIKRSFYDPYYGFKILQEARINTMHIYITITP